MSSGTSDLEPCGKAWNVGCETWLGLSVQGGNDS